MESFPSDYKAPDSVREVIRRPPGIIHQRDRVRVPCIALRMLEKASFQRGQVPQANTKCSRVLRILQEQPWGMGILS